MNDPVAGVTCGLKEALTLKLMPPKSKNSKWFFSGVSARPMQTELKPNQKGHKLLWY